MARVDPMIAGRVSSVSITDRSSAAWTIEQVVWVMKSNSSAFGRLRLSSVKVESMPPPIFASGNAARAALAIASTVGFSGRSAPGCQDFRSAALETTIELMVRPARFAAAAAGSSDTLGSTSSGTTISRTIFAAAASPTCLILSN